MNIDPQNDIISNISILDNFFGIFLLFRNKIKWFFYFKKAFKNYISVIKNFQNNLYPITAILKNNEKIILNSRNEVSLYSLLSVNKNCEYFEDTDSITLHIKNNTKKMIKLFGIKKNFDTILAFEDNTYDNIPLKDHIVIDIGTSIGDTPIYFALRGAAKVIGLEPFPQNFALAEKNIQENNFQHQIKLLLAGCSGNDGFKNVDPAFESDMRSQLDSSTTGVTIPMMSLHTIVDKFEVMDGILKVDCEGCEYDVILSSSDAILRKFQFIQVEYHYGYKNIQKKLENSGFKVKLTKLESYFENGRMKFFRGHLNATRQ